MLRPSADENYRALAIEKYKSGNYLEAIEAFNNSLALQEHWQSYQGLGWALFRTNQFPVAIEAFNNSVALHKHWQSYQGLGWALSKMQQYKSAIEAFNNSLALHQDWQSYQGLGLTLFQTKQYQLAVEAFNNSLALHQHWQSYQGLGWALSRTNHFPDAIKAFNKSIDLHEHWHSYKRLGLTLFQTKQYQLAVEAFNNSLALQEDWQSYNGLGLALREFLKDNGSIEYLKNLIKHKKVRKEFSELVHYAIANYYSSRKENGKALISIKTFKNTNKTIKPWRENYWFNDVNDVNDVNECTQKQIENYKIICNEKFYSFHPSYLSNNPLNESLSIWKGLVFLHIQKCAGSNFSIPFRLLHSYMQYENGNHPIWKGQDKIFLISSLYKFTSDLSNWKYICKMFEQSSSSDSYCKYLSQGYLEIHSHSWRRMVCGVEEASSLKPKIICLTRDPKSRLMSCLRHYQASCKTREDLLDIIERYKYQFDNCIDRYIYDYGLPELNPTISKKKVISPKHEKIDDIEFIDYRDSKTISSVKSSFLSALGMPNIVQFDRLNNSWDKKIPKDAISSEEIEDIGKECIDKGYIERDCKIDMIAMMKRTKKRLLFPEVIQKGDKLHPVTVIVKSMKEINVLTTSDFLANPLKFIDL